MKVLRNEAGLTLVEIMAVVMIIAIIAFVVGGNVFKQADAAKVGANNIQLKKIQDQLGQYRLATGKYPSNLEALTSAAQAGSFGAYIPTIKSEDLVDVWRTPLQYSVKSGGASYTLKSLGADAKAGGEGANADFEVTP